MAWSIFAGIADACIRRQRRRIVMHEYGNDLLQRLEPDVLSYDTILTLARHESLRERVDMALAYSGDQFVLNELAESAQWGYAVPAEGAAMWVEGLAVLGQSRKRDAAQPHRQCPGRAP